MKRQLPGQCQLKPQWATKKNEFLVMRGELLPGTLVENNSVKWDLENQNDNFKALKKMTQRSTK